MITLAEGKHMGTARSCHHVKTQNCPVVLQVPPLPPARRDAGEQQPKYWHWQGAVGTCSILGSAMDIRDYSGPDIPWMSPPNPPSLSTHTLVPREIRDVISCIVAPYTTQVPALLWYQQQPPPPYGDGRSCSPHPALAGFPGRQRTKETSL